MIKTKIIKTKTYWKISMIKTKMIKTKNLLENIYDEDRGELSWTEYLKTLDNEKQIQCIKECFNMFKINDWSNIITLNAYKQLCEENEYFTVFKTLINAYEEIFCELMDMRSEYTQLHMKLKENNYYIEKVLQKIIDASPHLINIPIRLVDI